MTTEYFKTSPKALSAISMTRAVKEDLFARISAAVSGNMETIKDTRNIRRMAHSRKILDEVLSGLGAVPVLSGGSAGGCLELALW